MNFFEERDLDPVEPITLTIQYTFTPATEKWDPEEDWEVITIPPCECRTARVLCHPCWFGEHVNNLGWEVVFDDLDPPLTWPGRGEFSSEFTITGKMEHRDGDDYFVVSEIQVVP